MSSQTDTEHPDSQPEVLPLETAGARTQIKWKSRQKLVSFSKIFLVLRRKYPISEPAFELEHFCSFNYGLWGVLIFPCDLRKLKFCFTLEGKAKKYCQGRAKGVAGGGCGGRTDPKVEKENPKTHGGNIPEGKKRMVGRTSLRFCGMFATKYSIDPTPVPVPFPYWV